MGNAGTDRSFEHFLTLLYFYAKPWEPMLKPLGASACALPMLHANEISVLQVSAPWAEAVYGAVQHELLMAILMENMYEPGRLRPPAEAPLAVGEHLPAPARQTGALGVDHSMAPKWRIAVDVPVIQVAVESLPAPASAPGQGPSLAEVHLSLDCFHCPCSFNFHRGHHQQQTWCLMVTPVNFEAQQLPQNCAARDWIRCT